MFPGPALELEKKQIAEETAATNAVVDTVKRAFQQVRAIFSKLRAAASRMGCRSVDQTVGVLGRILALPLASPLNSPMLWLLKKKGLPRDGELVGAGCKKKSEGDPGVTPTCPGKKAIPKGKIFYVNGIYTEFGTLCKTMRLLAETTCSEVTGIYNATGGIMADLQECVTNIAKNSSAPAAATLEQAMLAKLSKDPPEDVTIFAHSQGGLITQEAIARVKNQLAASYGKEEALRRLSHVHVTSFGTAEHGWPSGPTYEQFTNRYDPIPKVISAAQIHHPIATWKDNANIPDDKKHVIEIEKLDPIAAHSMNDLYIPDYQDRNPKRDCCGDAQKLVQPTVQER